MLAPDWSIEEQRPTWTTDSVKIIAEFFKLGENEFEKASEEIRAKLQGEK